MSEYTQFIEAQEKRKTIFARYVVIFIALFCVIFMLSGCNQWTPVATQDPELMPFFSRYEQVIGVSPWHIAASFEDINHENSRIMGTCTYSDTDYITVFRNHWGLTELSDEQLMFHELTHCAKGFKGHINGYRLDGCPLSVMNEYHMSDYCYSLHYEEYINELRSL